jgi:hypothetical protein
MPKLNPALFEPLKRIKDAAGELQACCSPRLM